MLTMNLFEFILIQITLGVIGIALILSVLLIFRSVSKSTDNNILRLYDMYPIFIKIMMLLLPLIGVFILSCMHSIFTEYMTGSPSNLGNWIVFYIAICFTSLSLILRMQPSNHDFEFA